MVCCVCGAPADRVTAMDAEDPFPAWRCELHFQEDAMVQAKWGSEIKRKSATGGSLGIGKHIVRVEKAITKPWENGIEKWFVKYVCSDTSSPQSGRDFSEFVYIGAKTLWRGKWLGTACGITLSDGQDFVSDMIVGKTLIIEISEQLRNGEKSLNIKGYAVAGKGGDADGGPF